MNFTTYRVKATTITDLLGTVPLDPDTYDSVVAAKAPEDQPTDDETEMLPEEPQKGVTGFLRDSLGRPMIASYSIKGFFKEACGMLRRVSGSHSANLTSYKKVIDGMVFVDPRFIIIHTEAPITRMTRPLRAQTARGERICLATSEVIAVGAVMEFEVQVMGNTVKETMLREWLDYGKYLGLGQWRAASWGRFTYQMEAA